MCGVLSSDSVILTGGHKLECFSIVHSSPAAKDDD
jgi:hypothetical protein